ncbi:unnamed protein product [Lactuca virosa]|uniref:Uncharacterized protein n=1 Tax=Lactuca virosa TaxID=75947 RepID=A0AAU9MTH1_9ASTR|nr:unnamed protein product [Lactuca virosa]
MDSVRWSATIDHFLTDMRCKQSNNLNKLKVFHRVHVNKQGEFVGPLVKEQYNSLFAEVALQTQHIADSGGDPNSIDWITLFEKVLGARRGHNALVAEVALQTQHIADSGGDPNSIDWIALFENVLGARRGNVRGIRPKLSVAGTSAPSQWQSQSQTPQPTPDVDVNAFL